MILGLIWMIQLSNLIIPSVGERTARSVVRFYEVQRAAFVISTRLACYCLSFEIVVQEVV
jgi:hypothetical protein